MPFFLRLRRIILINSTTWRHFLHFSRRPSHLMLKNGLKMERRRPRVEYIGGNTRLTCICNWSNDRLYALGCGGYQPSLDFVMPPEMVWGVPTSNCLGQEDMGGTKCLRLGRCELKYMGGVLQNDSSMRPVRIQEQNRTHDKTA
jgi:hypothetical protein